MKKSRLLLVAVFWSLLVLPAISLPYWVDTSSTARPIELADISAWRSTRSATLSNDGQWFAHRVGPREGDSEVVFRKTRDSKELRFPGGEAPEGGGRGGGGRGNPEAAPARDISFSEDSKWAAYTVFPSAREGRRGRGAGAASAAGAQGAATPPAAQPSNKVVLLNLATEKKVEFERIRRASFSGENPNWLALYRYAPETQGRGGAGAGVGAATPPAGDRVNGADLLLHDLTTGADLNIGNVSEFSFDKKGQWLAWIVDAQDKSGNGVQLRNMTSGVILPLESDKAVYKGLDWTEKGDGLAVLKGVDDSGYEEKLYSVIGFTNLSSSAPQKIVFDPRTDNSFPAGMTVSPNRNPVFMEDLQGVLFGIHEVRKKKEEPGRRAQGGGEAAARAESPGREVGPPGRNRPETTGSSPGAEQEKPDLVIWHYLDKRLQSQQQVEETRDKNFSFLCVYRVTEKKFIRLADESLRQVTAGANHRFAVGLDTNEYELMGNLDGRRYEDVYAVDLNTGSRRLITRKSRWNFGASPDGTHFLYYDDGSFFTCDLTTGQSYNITKNVPATFINLEDDHNVVKPPVRPIGWTKGSASVLLSDDWDIWNVPAHGGQAVNLTVNGKKDQIRYRTIFRLDFEDRNEGIDLSKPTYMGMLAEMTKKGGISRLDGGKAGPRTLLSDDALFPGLLKAKSADVVLYTRENYKDSPEYYVTDNSLQGGQKITETNPKQKDFLWSAGSRLISYTSAKGDKLQGALFLPANYVEGKSYPTIVYIYEKLTQGFNAYTAPTANGFNKSVYTSNGYAVLMPDIVYKVNDPGMSAVWCVVPAVKAAIATGVVDPARVGIHGHSWGGYQTAFLVTQTDLFRAAIAGAPLTNMISMYSSIYWNSGGGDGAIFESSQGRFLGGYWDNLESYQRNSPVYHAKNVKTPLMILHNDRDGAVDFNQGIEYFNTLRRMQKPVVMLQYRGENHGLRIPANMKDYTVRMKEYFDHHLMGKEAPAWLKEGVPLIKMKDHIEERTNDKTKEKAVTTGSQNGAP